MKEVNEKMEDGMEDDGNNGDVEMSDNNGSSGNNVTVTRSVTAMESVRFL